LRPGEAWLQRKRAHPRAPARVARRRATCASGHLRGGGPAALRGCVVLVDLWPTRTTHLHSLAHRDPPGAVSDRGRLDTRASRILTSSASSNAEARPPRRGRDGRAGPCVYGCADGA